MMTIGFTEYRVSLISYKFAFLWSAKNFAKPMSVKGCLSNPKIEVRGQVQTSAPASAARTMCNGLRIEAAKISVAKP